MTLVAENDVKVTNETLDHHSLNAMLNLYDKEGKIQFEADKKAAREYIINHVNANLVTFESLEEKLEFLVEQGYYEGAVLEQYDDSFVKNLYKNVYDTKFRFETYMGAFKFYQSYALRTFDGARYLERFEDRVAITALYLGRGDERLASQLADEMISGRYQPATPTFLNAGKARRGELVSCFLVRTEDNMESIARGVNAVLQLSKRGGGVAISLTNLREVGAPIKGMADQAAGVIPVAKMIEDAVSYANQLGQRDGAAAIYLSVHHPDVLQVLDSKRENADARIRLNRLSIGLVVTDIVMQKFKSGETFYTFSPYDIEKEYGVAMSDLSITEKYDELVNNPRIKKHPIDARKFMKILAEVQFESGYPYIMFEDTVNAASNIDGRVSMSNLCSEILQVSTPTTYGENLNTDVVGNDISCNLGSLNIAKTMYGGNLDLTVNSAIRALTAVSDLSNVECVPSVAKGNSESHAIGLGQMNLHGFLASEGIYYGSEESIDFVSAYFAAVAYSAVKASNEIATETGIKFAGFENSKYASGEYFAKYMQQSWGPKTKVASDLFAKYGIKLPTREDWTRLAALVKTYGMYNAYLQAIPPTGSISYINNSTSSIHPIVAQVESRKEGKIGRVYVAAFGLTNENREYYQDAYEIGAKKLIDVYAAATEHVDQGLSCTLFFTDEATTKTINMAQGYAWSKGIKTLYYIRLRQTVLSGADVEGCVSCAL
ncbi:ribonucleotide reductase [Microbacterium phage Pumpernickel]|uniref:Ribonucleoside-diphosphate reductase n=1 Tax=Microbacterium phage Pumpernickel TaxID=2885983 RepID=A0AAE9C3I2_9CAUD|nr:ribonucleotide reductase [Microbacterium phage Pumpernickel]UDL15949.1 ribonucleotide reductase [Microbacterium phage Pumpernickel]